MRVVLRCDHAVRTGCHNHAEQIFADGHQYVRADILAAAFDHTLQFAVIVWLRVCSSRCKGGRTRQGRERGRETYELDRLPGHVRATFDRCSPIDCMRKINTWLTYTYVRQRAPGAVILCLRPQVRSRQARDRLP